MTEDLEKNIQVMVKQQGGRLSENLRSEFIVLCQTAFQYRPDMSCGKCIYKYAVKLFDKYIK